MDFRTFYIIPRKIQKSYKVYTNNSITAERNFNDGCKNEDVLWKQDITEKLHKKASAFAKQKQWTIRA